MSADIDSLIRDLGRVRNVQPFLKTALTRTSVRIKNDWNSHLYSDGHAARTAGSVTFEIKTALSLAGGYDLVSEIGPVTGRGRQAGITRLLETGSVNNPPHGAGSAALHRNEGDFERGIRAAINDALRRGGL